MERGHQVWWAAQGVADIQSFDLPTPGTGQVLVRNHVTLISPGTERAFFLGQPNAAWTFPSTPIGYSAMGEVAELGPNVENLRIGQRVVCTVTHASHAVVDANACIPVADSVADEEAVFFNLISIALQGVRKARVELGEPVVVIGAGVIGLLAMQLARLQGAVPVVSVDKDSQRLALAQKFGADVALEANDQLPAAVVAACAPSGPSVVIEATGNPIAVNLAFQLARRFGRVIILGSTRGDVDHVNFYRDIHKKGLTIIGAHTSTCPSRDSAPAWWTLHDDWRAGLKLMERRRLDVNLLLTHRFPWKDAPQAYTLLAKGDLSAQAMLIDWRGC